MIGRKVKVDRMTLAWACQAMALFATIGAISREPSHMRLLGPASRPWHVRDCVLRPSSEEKNSMRNLYLRGSGAEAAVVPVAEETQPRTRVGGRECLTAAQLEAFDKVMKRRFFFGPSFYIHGGVSGLFDYGPTGCAVKKSIIAAWREHFVVEEGMLEVDCPSLTPEPVLAASGHVQRFTDLMVRDEISGECFRADKLLEETCAAALARLASPGTRSKELQKAAAAAAASGVPGAGGVALVAVLEAAGDGDKRSVALERLRDAAGSMSAADIDCTLSVLNVTSPSTGARLSASFPFNLMFPTSIGPSGTTAGFMRPETAQVCVQ